MIRLIASDIDGTLLPYGESAISEEIFTQIRRLADKGILFCPTSGRQYTSMRRLFAPVADQIPYLSENGAIVTGPGSPGPVLHKTIMGQANAVALCRAIVDTPDLEVLISGADTNYLCPKGDEILPVMQSKGCNIVLLDRPEDVPEDIVKIAAYSPHGPQIAQRALLPHWGEVFHAAVAGLEWMDFTLADKGSGLTRMCAALGIGLDEVAAFGDNFNDEPMLSVAGQPWIMEASDPVLKERFPNHCRRVVDILKTF